MSFVEYPQYRESRLEWLPRIPTHWVDRKIARDMSFVVGWTPPSGKQEFYDGDLPWVTIADMTQMTVDDTKSKISHLAVQEKGAEVVPAGSMLFSFKLSVGKVSFLAIDSYTNEAIASFLPGGSIDLAFWKYAAPEFIPKYGRENIYGATLLNQELIGSVRFFTPEKVEQAQIARFLDHETAKIDALIEQQQRLIELLKEKRQAVISHAVTKGLDPNVPMKDSGVEWLGEVPAHWKVGALRWYAAIQGGIAKGKEYGDKNLIVLPYLRVANVQSGHIDLSEVKEIQVLEDEVERYSLKPGDVLMNEGGDNDKLGRGAVWRGQIEPCLHQNHVFAIRPIEGLSSDWLAIFTQAGGARIYFFIHSKQITNLASISASNVMGMHLPIPSVDEQISIIQYLGKDQLAFEELVSQGESTINLLQERRSALISAAVTGKIDVRNWQPPASASQQEQQQERAHG